jgi:hypothetical protein
MSDRTRPLLRRAGPPTAHAALLALALAALCTSAAAPAVADQAHPTTQEFSVVATDAEIAQSDEEPAGSGTAEPGEPSAWNGILGLLAWVLVAAVGLGFLMWMLFVRSRRPGNVSDDDAPDRESQPS